MSIMEAVPMPAAIAQTGRAPAGGPPPELSLPGGEGLRWANKCPQRGLPLRRVLHPPEPLGWLISGYDSAESDAARESDCGSDSTTAPACAGELDAAGSWSTPGSWSLAPSLPNTPPPPLRVPSPFAALISSPQLQPPAAAPIAQPPMLPPYLPASLYSMLATEPPSAAVPCTGKPLPVGKPPGLPAGLVASTVAPTPIHFDPLFPKPTCAQPPQIPALPELLSMGSAMHGSGMCRPCAWFWKPMGCRNGQECRHCHACPADELKVRKKAKVTLLRGEALTDTLAGNSGSVAPQHFDTVSECIGTVAACAMAAEPEEATELKAHGPPGLQTEQPAAAELLSRGSALHGTGECQPCAWFWKPQGCLNGEDCRRCHACPEGEVKLRRKAKVLAIRANVQTVVTSMEAAAVAAVGGC